MSSPFSFGTRILGGGAALLLLFLLVGLLLPGTWTAERSVVVAAPPGALFPFLDGPEGWRRWTPWPDSGVTAEGPRRGAGARMVWTNRELGSGSFEIVDAGAGDWVRYRVSVQDGAMRTEGQVHLEAVPEGTRITWREEGDFGHNPLLGYWARFMRRAQGAEMEKALGRLEEEALRHPETPTPPDSLSGGATR